MTEHRPAAPLLVLGSTGKLGQILRKHWKDRKDVIWQGRKPVAGVTLVWSEGDGLEVLPPVRAVVALWGVVPGAGGDLEDNARLAQLAMRIASAPRAPRVLHCSSAAIYRPGPAPLTENDPPEPQTPYGRAKLAMEEAVRDWRAQNATPPAACLMRIGNVIGADSLFAAMATADRTGRSVTLDRFGDGQGPRRSYLSGADLARCLEALSECPLRDLPEVVNLAGHRAVAMADLARHASHIPQWREAPPEAAPLVELGTGRLRSLLDLGPESGTAPHLMAD